MKMEKHLNDKGQWTDGRDVKSPKKRQYSNREKMPRDVKRFEQLRKERACSSK